MTTVQHSAVIARQPEAKYGPFAGGISVAIWRRTIDTDNGPQDVRSVTVNPRRYLDSESGEWKDGSYRPSDLPVLILALQSAQQFIALHPLETVPQSEAQESQTPF